ncbi:NAD-dependent epimerase/dehydratase family protein [Microbacterium protaetiae]|uniref:NAD-dependent epimerase/dehydratase family protein n=1 Tax=Microbacterium protaetiae TaxID=2509458 RepID=A0A4P6E8W5_9MICO|nr:NAD-dependent epimerase/dehydratase family protein [Microbacterium protaetiae]QAY58582.1 NAD-dependent epimerase/dehydratase family protein [Microbacterium protaetiae]
MKVFLTGGTGYVGSVLREHLLAAGHEVDALARTTAGAQRLTAAGATVVRGSLADTGVLRAAAARAEAVVHAAFDGAMTDDAAATELAAVRALAAGAGESKTAKPVLYTSTGLVYGIDPRQDRHEDAQLPERSAQPVKGEGERALLTAEGITPIVFRAALVHGRGGSKLVTGLISSAASTGAAPYIDEGAHVWDAIDVDDLANLYVAALAHPLAGVYNVKGEHPFTMRELAQAVSTVTGAQPVSLPRESASATLGPLALVLGAPGLLAGDKARSTFDWTPVGGSLLDDIRDGSYRDVTARTAGVGA